MSPRYSMLIRWSEENQVFVVSLPEFGDYAQTHGDTHEEAVRNGQEVLDLLIESFQAEGRQLPAPRFYEETMNYLTIDPEFCDHLRGLLETVELRDASGKVLGHFTPFVSQQELALYEKAEALFDPVEVERRLKEQTGKGVSLEEIMQRLRSLETPQ